MDWEYPPSLTTLNKFYKSRPVDIDVQNEGNNYSIKYNYSYFQQDNIPEGNSIVQLVQIGKNHNCFDKSSDVSIIKNMPNINNKFTLPINFNGKVAIRVMPSSKSKISNIWYYSPTRSISINNSMVVTCPVNIVAESINLKIEQINKYMQLTWSEILDVNFYEIEMSINNEAWNKSGVVSAPSSEYEVHDTDSEKKYSFRIRGCNNENKCTNYSNIKYIDAIKSINNDVK